MRVRACVLALSLLLSVASCGNSSPQGLSGKSSCGDYNKADRTAQARVVRILAGDAGRSVDSAALTNYLGTAAYVCSTHPERRLAGLPFAKHDSSGAAADEASCTYHRTGPSSAKPPVPFAGLPPARALAPPQVDVHLETSRGSIGMRLESSKAPCTVNSFLYLARRGYYDQTSCHRLTRGGLSILQCGDPSGTGMGGPGYEFNDENLQGATYGRGTLAMANAGANTNGSQFFIVYADSQLPPSYTPFGTVTSGLEVIDRVAAAGPTSAQDARPRLAVVVQKVTEG